MSRFNNNYPYTDFHELNLDWFLDKFTELNDKYTLTLNKRLKIFLEEKLNDIFANVTYEESNKRMVLHLESKIFIDDGEHIYNFNDETMEIKED